MKETIKKPIKFIGIGEKLDDFEVFTQIELPIEF